MDWWVSMPKVELHAHLNGSIRDFTLLELARELGHRGLISFSDVERVILKHDRSLSEVFKLFDLIHILTTDHETVTRITKEVVEDFAAENVVYLELRTTPKKNDSKGMSKSSYVEAVLEGLRAVTTVDVDIFSEPNFYCPANAVIYARSEGYANNGTGRKKIFVRLLLSIDRRETTEAAMETVKLALEMRHLGIVGIDLSGNPIIGEWLTFLPVLEFAKEQGLLITLHCGEVPNPVEIHAMLDFHPARIGHACCFGEEEWAKLKSLKIPVRNFSFVLPDLSRAIHFSVQYSHTSMSEQILHQISFSTLDWNVLKDRFLISLIHLCMCWAKKGALCFHLEYHNDEQDAEFSLACHIFDVGLKFSLSMILLVLSLFVFGFIVG